ncbi:hypothetical protein DMB66_17850 [Actinoplanes sp. ATCC 53533]|nr:hypothetical protein DMB66_17850 [Actinoplanes sp. ATCC 53533]
MARVYVELRAVRPEFKSVEINPVAIGSTLATPDRGYAQDQPPGPVLVVPVFDVDHVTELERAHRA